MFIVHISPVGTAGVHYLPPGIGTHSVSHSSPWGEYSAFSAAVAIHTEPIFIPPGTYYCWVDTGGANSKLVQAF